MIGTIRKATISDNKKIAKELWNIRRHFKSQQIASALQAYPSTEAIANMIGPSLKDWFVCESADPFSQGFYSVSIVSDDKAYKRWGFPKQFAKIDHFSCLLPGEILLNHFKLLTSHLSKQSILLVIPSSLRDVHWAALKAGFQLLGECPLMVGYFVWLYLDRDNQYDEIRMKLRRAKVVC